MLHSHEPNVALSTKSISTPCRHPTKHNSNLPTPNLLPSALLNDNSTHSKTPSKHRADSSTTSNSQFAPFFTLVEDIHTTQHHHPTVHYIFSDDSTDLITEAALRTLEPPLPSSSSSITPSNQHSHNPYETNNNNTPSTTDDDPTHPSPLPLLPPPRPGITDRYILLDLSLPPSPSASSNAVPSAHAQSLTPDWQVLNVEVSRAPTWDADPDPRGTGAAERNRGLMLKIEGTEGVRGGLKLGIGDGDGERGGWEGEVDMEGLVGVFENRMAELRRLIDVEAGGGGE